MTTHPDGPRDPDYNFIYSGEKRAEGTGCNDAKDATVKKIAGVLERQFSSEIEALEKNILLLDERLNEARLVMDRLRACLIISYFDEGSSNPKSSCTRSSEQPGIHPAVRREIGKTLPNIEKPLPRGLPLSDPLSQPKASAHPATPVPQLPEFKTHRIVVGNVSKYLPPDDREKNDRVRRIHISIYLC